MRKSFPTLALAIPFASGLAAQCTTAWQPGAAVPGVDGDVAAMIRWDPDGAGPATPLLVLAGSFRVVGNTQANNIVGFDRATGAWVTFGAGIDGSVNALAVLPSGELVAGGYFLRAGGVVVNSIARWNGAAWAPLGNGFQGPIAGPGWLGEVRSMATTANGDLYAGGRYFGAGFVPANIQRWDGSNWSVVGGGVDDLVRSIAALPNGDVIVGGWFQVAGGTAIARLARWDGATWAPVGSGLSAVSVPIEVSEVEVMANGDLVVGGSFEQAGGVVVNGLARWNGSSWTGFGLGVGATYTDAIAELPNGDLLVGGVVDLPGAPFTRLARWNPTQGWTPLVSDVDGIFDLLVLPGGEFVAGGRFTTIGGTVAASVAVNNGLVWTALDTGTGGAFFTSVFASEVLRNGDVVVGGSFGQIEGVAANNVARWNGSGWSPLGLGVNGFVHAIEELPNGELVVCGSFDLAGGLPVTAVARWNGATWSPMPGLSFGGLPADPETPFNFGYVPWVGALATLPNGVLVAGGFFDLAGGQPAGNLASWNGSSWVSFASGTDSPVRALAALPNGDLIVGGAFTRVGGVAANGVARWNGSAWSPLGTGVPFEVLTLAVMPNGDLVAGGDRYGTDKIARWDGSNWNPMGGGFDRAVVALLVLPDGDLLAGGGFELAGGAPNRGIARWDGAAWNAVDSGCNGSVQTLAFLPDGAVLAGGNFTIAGGQVAARLARLRATCPATAVATGTGCTGSTGPVQLVASNLPWLGGTFRSVATGLPGNSLALEIRGLSTAAVALPSVLPQGVAGCTLQVAPDLLGLVVPSQGTANSAFAIPSSPGILGAVLYQQIAPVEFSVTGAIRAVTTSNALALTIGVF